MHWFHYIPSPVLHSQFRGTVLLEGLSILLSHLAFSSFIPSDESVFSLNDLNPTSLSGGVIGILG